MQKKVALATLTVLVLFCAAAATSQEQQSDENSSYDQVKAAIKIQFRDTAELHVRQWISFTLTDAHGRVRKHNEGSLNLSYQGFNPRKPYAIAGELSVDLGEAFNVVRHGLHKLSANNDLWSVFPIALILVPEEPGKLSFVTTNVGDIKMTPLHSCPAFTVDRQHDLQSAPYMPDRPCGTGEFQIDSDLSLKSFTFEAGGLPAQVNLPAWEKCTLRTYRVVVEYHQIMLPSDPKPFVVPLRVTVTLESDKGVIEIMSHYQPNEPAQHFQLAN